MKFQVMQIGNPHLYYLLYLWQVDSVHQARFVLIGNSYPGSQTFMTAVGQKEILKSDVV